MHPELIRVVALLVIIAVAVFSIGNALILNQKRNHKDDADDE